MRRRWPVLQAQEGSNKCVVCGLRCRDSVSLEMHIRQEHYQVDLSAEQIMDHWISSAPPRARKKRP